jgi:hypothetical protein
MTALASVHVSTRPNGLRYPLVGGTGQRCFDGTNFKLRKLPENAQTPTSVLAGIVQDIYFLPLPRIFSVLTNRLTMSIYKAAALSTALSHVLGILLALPQS